MQYHWLNRKGNRSLIIFFAGWSFDYKPFEILECGNFDVLVFYDYTEHSIPVEIPEYEKYYLITWSMGVYIAYLLRDRLPEFEKKIAINGTPFPIDNTLGIPRRTFDLTLKFVDTGLEGKFQRNLFNSEEGYDKYLKNPVLRDIPNQAGELRALNDFISNANPSYEKFYDCAIVSEYDKIIPPKNQLNCWNERANVFLLKSGHFPFFEFDGWKDILENAIKS